MSYTREQIEAHEQNAQSLCDRLGFQQHGESAAIIRQLLAENDALREDAERLDWLQSSKTSHGFCHTGYGEYAHYAHQQDGFPDVREAIDAARKNGRGMTKYRIIKTDGEEVLHGFELGEIVFLVVDDGTQSKGYKSESGQFQWVDDDCLEVVRD